MAQAYTVSKEEVPKFSGASNENAKRWIERIEEFAKLFNRVSSGTMRNAHRLRIFRMGLTGGAEAWFELLPTDDQAVYSEAVRLFKIKYVNSDSGMVNYVEMDN